MADSRTPSSVADPPPLDLVALRRTLAMSFTRGEISDFAVAFGLHLDREGAADDAARQLLRAVTNAGAERRLLSHLREAKPLVVWPELPPERETSHAPAETAPTVPGAPLDLGGGPIPSAGSAPAAAARSVASAATDGHAPVKLAPDGPSGGERSPQSPADAKIAAAPLVDPFLEAPDALAAGQGNEAASARLVATVAVALSIGLVGGGAFTLWMMRDRATTAPTPAPTSSAPSPDAASVSQLAADMLAGSVGAVVDACDVARPPDESARTVLADAFDNCRRLDTLPRPRPLRPPPPRRPAAERPAPVRGTTPARPSRPSQRRSVTGTCLNRCHSAYLDCQRTRCGEEPQSARAYPEWQRCKGGCLPDYSTCRQGCL
ncbi:MAG: hypothetical protein AAF715_29845 [Myxococcota bacterium]